MPPVFEVRIPTYNRPDLLRRALESLLAQTYPHWMASVYDDASAGEEVVRALNDDRIRYCGNHPTLGAAANIDQCFSPIAASAGDYGCLLEDDNFWLPDFLSNVAMHVKDKVWPLLLANQRIWSQDIGLHPMEETTRGRWFSYGPVTPLYLRATTLFMEGLSNGGLVWKLDGCHSLQVGPAVRDAGLQEVCRSLLVKEMFLFMNNAHAVFSYMPKQETARAKETSRTLNRGLQSIRRFIIQFSGPEVISAANDIAAKSGLNGALSELLAHSGYPGLTGHRAIMSRSVLRAYLKGIALRKTQPDPCSRFLSDLISKIRARAQTEGYASFVQAAPRPVPVISGTQPEITSTTAANHHAQRPASRPILSG